MTTSTGNRNAILLALGLALAAVPIAAEARGGADKRPSFEQLDANSDGEVTQAEIDAHRASRFSEADTNGDGALSRDEMLARARDGADERMSKRIDRMMERLDANSDGKLTQDEMAAAKHGRKGGRGGDMFERLDTDKSGGISKEEFEQAKSMRKGKRGQSQSQDN